MKIKKALKKVFVFSLIVFTILMIAIAIAMNFIFTPEKITPEIIELINENVNAKIDCEEIDPAFFSTFPYFSIRLKNGSVVNNKSLTYDILNESENDTLAKFKTCQITINVLKLLTQKSIDIKNIIFKNPEIYAIIGEDGSANWNILKPSAPEIEDTNKTTTSNYLKNFNVDNLEIEQANLHYEDRFTQAKVDITAFKLKLKISRNSEGIVFSAISSGKDILFIKDQIVFLNKLKLDLKTDIVYTKQIHTIEFIESQLNINNTTFLADGNLVLNKSKKEIETDLHFYLNVPSLKTFISLIPETVLQNKNNLISEGKISLEANLKGVYGKNVFPNLTTKLSIENGAFKFKDYPGEIEEFSTIAEAEINFNTPKYSYANIEQLTIKGSGINLNANANIKNIIKNANVNTSIKGQIDLKKIKDAFPLNENIAAHGLTDIDLTASFTKKAILNQDFKSISAKGSILLKNISINHKAEDFIFKSKNININFDKNHQNGQLNQLSGILDFADFTFKYKKTHYLQLDQLNIGLNTEKTSTSKRVLNAEIALENLNYAFGDSIKGSIKKTKANVAFTPSEYEKRPLTVANFTIDSIAIKDNKNFLSISNGKYELTFENDEYKIWQPKGFVEFNALYLFTPKFPVVIEMQHSKVTVANTNLSLNEARLKFGKSDATLTGKVSHFRESFQGKKVFEAELNLNSNFIDANEIMALLNDNSEAITAINSDNKIKIDTLDPSKKSIFIIPKNINFKFNTNIKKVRFDNLDLTDIHGLVTIKNQEINLENLYLKTLAANLKADFRYKAQSQDEANISYSMNIEDLQMNDLTTLIPALEALFPMSKSFDGLVNFRTKGSSKLNKNMDVIIPSIKSIAALQANNLVVFDSPTFADISKALMFKNKEQNLIDSFRVEMSIENSHLEILPAELTLDRYHIAAGGIQNLDKTYEYHISILKSPVPFKAGVDIIGDFEDYDIDLTKAKYKYYFTKKKRLIKKADSTIIIKKLYIQKELGF